MPAGRLRVWGAAVAFVVLAGVLVGLSGADGVAAPAGPALDWHDCPGTAGFQCASMPVPLDYDQPDGQQITVAVIRHPATDPAHRIGSLFFNPGGPGGSGLSALPLLYPLFPPRARARFDLVSFDPRGIGQSNPVQCFDTKEEEDALLGQLPAGFPVGTEQQQTWNHVLTEFDQACGRHAGPILDHVSTANVARDMDRLRAAVGDSQLSYYGPSYGSYLGATYANLFPSRVRAIVLDGSADPASWKDTTRGAMMGTFLRLGSDLGSSSTRQLFLDECGQVDPQRCAFSAGSPSATAAKYDTLLSRLSTRPVVVDGVQVTYAVAVGATVGGLYEQNPIPKVATGWRGLAATLQLVWNATAGATTAPAAATAPAGRAPWPVLGVPDGAGALGYAGPEATLGVFCSESPNPRQAWSYPVQDRMANLRAPYVGSSWTWLAAGCQQWPATDQDRYSGPFDKPTAPILVVAVQHDPATPYEASERMTSQLSNARLLAVTGGGHTALLNKSSCADRYLDEYFIDGALPAAGTVCQQDTGPF